MKYYVGIDPGKSGAIAVLTEDGEGWVEDLPQTLHEYSEYLFGAHSYIFGDNDVTVIVEDVRGRPGQSVVANTTFMKYAGYAELLGAYIATGGNMSKVSPVTWKKYFGLTGNKELTVAQRKGLSVDLARRLYPQLEKDLLKSKDGRSEALLLAHYCKELNDDNKKTTEKRTVPEHSVSDVS